MATHPADDLALRMAADGPLAAVLTGGVYVTRTSDKSIISPADTPDAYDEVAGVPLLKPCAVVGVSSTSPSAPVVSEKRMWLRVGVYQAAGYEATSRALDLLHSLVDPYGEGDGAYFELEDGNGYHITHVDDPVRESVDDTIPTGLTARGASYEAARFRVETDWQA